MKSKTIIVFFTLTFFLVTGLVTQSFSQESKQLFQQGLMAENGEGNLQDAISIYEKIVADESAENSVKAKAQLHIGLCYEKLGKAEAIRAYELVLQNYQNYEAEVQLASLRLADLIKVDDKDLSIINLYGKGSSVKEGTSLENSSLSPDGSKMVGIEYSIGQNVAVYDLQTREIELITKYDWETPGHGWTYFPVWSPNGKEIAYLFSDWEGSYEVQVSTLQGQKRMLIKNESIGGQIYPRQWSKDGSVILTFKQDTAGFYTIGLVPAKGGAFRALHKTQWTGQFIKGDASLSPDGKYIIFADGKEDNLDLFIMNTKGGTPILISGNPANEYDPLWSPDGKFMVFIKETKGESLLYALEITEGKPTGQPFLIKEGMQNVGLMNWTEYGIAYSMSFNLHDIYTIPLDMETGIPTAIPKPLDYTPVGSNICPVWSHDGKYLAFISYADKPEVVILTIEGGETRHYPIHAPGFWELTLGDLHWLPDNSGLSFNVRSPKEIPTVYRLDLASGEWQNWPLPVSIWSLTDWGPDENSFIYTSGGPEPGIYQFNINTEETKHIFQPKESSFYIFRALKYSMDRKKVTFMYQSEMDINNLMVLDIESGEEKIIGENCMSPTFSPDGQKIVAHYDSKITIFSLDGEILQQYDLFQYFTSGTRIYGFDWSPDGKQLVFMTRNIVDGTYLMKNVLK